MITASGGFAYREYGERRSDAVILLHGFLGSGADWAPIAEAIGGYCVAFDLPGHGATPIDAVSPVTLERLGQGLAQAIVELGIERYILVGYSLGGRAALSLVRHAPRSCAALCLESAHPGLEDQDLRVRRRAGDSQLAERLKAIGTERFLREWYAQDLFASLRDKPELLEGLIAGRKGQPSAGLAEALIGFSLGEQQPGWDLLSGLRVPLHYVAGESDQRYLAIADLIQRRAPQAIVHRVPGAGHSVHLERPELFVEILREI